MKIPTGLDHRSDYRQMVFLGFLLAVHWTTFFGAIQMSTVALGLLSFSSFAIFVTFLEPILFKERMRKADIVSAVVCFLGIGLIVPEFNLSNDSTRGILVGLISGFSYALLSIYNRKAVERYSGIQVAYYEQLFAMIFLLPFLFFQETLPTGKEMGWLILLGILFTGVGHSLFIGGLKQVKAQTAAVITCAEPVYSIILAGFLLNEIPTEKELVGGAIILGTVIWSTLRAK